MIRAKYKLNWLNFLVMYNRILGGSKFSELLVCLVMLEVHVEWPSVNNLYMDIYMYTEVDALINWYFS